MVDVSLQPLDIIVFKGIWYKPSQGLVMWRSISDYCHCVTISKDKDVALDANTDGLHKRYLSSYSGLEASICRLKDPSIIDTLAVAEWMEKKFDSAKGYDFLAWLGFATGIKGLEDEDKWYCAELPYWGLMENGVRLTNTDLTFIYPSFFVDSPLFEIIYDGVI